MSYSSDGYHGAGGGGVVKRPLGFPTLYTVGREASGSNTPGPSRHGNDAAVDIWSILAERSRVTDTASRLA